MSTHSNTPLIAGAVIMILFGVAVLFGLNATQGNPLAERKEVTVAFDDLSGLNRGDDVRIASKRVGHVSELRIDDGTAVAVLKLDDPSTQLYENAQAARISDRSALGQKYVNLDPGSPETGALRDDSTIPATQTTKSEDVNELFDTLDPRTREASSTALKNLGGGLIGHEADLNDAVSAAPGILDNLATVSRTLAEDDGASLVAMLESADALSSRLTGRHEEIADLTRQLGTSMDALGVDEGEPLEASLVRGPETLDDATAALTSLNTPLADTRSAVTTLRPGASALGDSVPDVRGVLREGIKPLRRVPDVAEKAEPAVEDLTSLTDDARPLATQLVKTGDGAAPPVSVFGQYADEIANYFTQAGDALSHGDDAGHWLRIMLLPGVESAVGLEVPGTTQRDPYPAPGQAAKNKSAANGGNR
ncbi:MlaD family protein [Aeromicrobium sp. CTD01-1L150]|uniref:MlaD family protein n=1 Tax=Aeromicrobium sp. CTD01-1L150 TaxID=3341830 RepID=UPI0035C098B5